MIEKRIAVFEEELLDARRRNIGFPGATDFDYSPLSRLLSTELLNNVGDPWVDGVGRNHTKQFEREIVDWVADLFRAPLDDRWGYVTSGGTEANYWALRLAQRAFAASAHTAPDEKPVVYYNERAHYSIPKVVRDLHLTAVRIRADQFEQMDYDDLRDQVNRRRDRPAIVVATIGTTMAEAIDDVRKISGILDQLAVVDRFIHADAALAGVPLALLDPAKRPGFDFCDGADSIAISGHKFFGSPMPCGVVVTRKSLCQRSDRHVSYTASPDTTISGSRSGHTPLILWYAIEQHGVDGHRQRAEQARDLAAYAHEQLQRLGWPTYRHPHAFTVVLRTPPHQVQRKGWVLATDNGWSHLITMPGVTEATIQDFLADMAAAIAQSRSPATLWGNTVPMPIFPGRDEIPGTDMAIVASPVRYQIEQ